MTPTIRPARSGDAEAIARIYNAGIDERVATLQTRAQNAPEIAEQISSGRLLLVAEDDGGRVAGWASVGPYDDAHDYYSGVGEATLYIEPAVRRGGAGRTLLNALADEAERRGYFKLVGKVFTSNGPSIALVRSCG